jgi:hypothetical protein
VDLLVAINVAHEPRRICADVSVIRSSIRIDALSLVSRVPHFIIEQPRFDWYLFLGGEIEGELKSRQATNDEMMRCSWSVSREILDYGYEDLPLPLNLWQF